MNKRPPHKLKPGHKLNSGHKLKPGIVLVLTGAALAASAAPDSFVTVRDDLSPLLSRSKLIAHADPAQVLHINVSLRSPKLVALEKFVEEVSNPTSLRYRKFATPANLGAMFGQSPTTVQSVAAYLKSQGLTVKLVAQSRLNIMADGTVSQVEKAFNTTINRYRPVSPAYGEPSEYYASARALQAPASLAPQILTVTGLQNYSRPKPAILTMGQAQQLYGTVKEFTAGMYGQGRTLAYSNYDGYRTSNLPLFYSQFSLPAPAKGVGSNVSVVTVDGGSGTGTPNGEGDLDMQMILGMAPQCSLIVYDGSQSEVDVLTKEQEDNKADVISESYGWGMPPSDEDACHQIHLLMSAEGITYLCAAGDRGTSFLETDQAVYPDIDPEVLVVGGSVATTDAVGNRLSETAWAQGGGGYSTDSAKCNVLPSYQQLGTRGMPANIQYRLTPDVALNASGTDPMQAAFAFFWNGQLVNYGAGTSFSSPIFAGGLGIAEQKLISIGGLPADASGHHRFGRIQDLFYGQNLRSDVWYDITSGSNGSLINGELSNAGPGWDTASGLGAINFDAFVNSLGKAAPLALSVSPSQLVEGASASGTVTLPAPATAGVATIVLSTTDPAQIGVPATVTVPSGSTTVSFVISTKYASAPYSATIKATYGGQSATANLGVELERVSGLTVAESSVLGGSSTTGTVRLLASAPTGGWSVKLANSSPAYATIPAQVVVAANTNSASFKITTKAYTQNYPVTITASDANGTEMATLTVTDDSVSKVSLSPSTIAGGGSSTGTVTLVTAAPSSGWKVKLASGTPTLVGLPGSVTVPAGASSATFTVTSKASPSAYTTTITASDALSSKRATLSVITESVKGLTLSPSSVIGTKSSKGTVTLVAAAPAGGYAVKLTSADPDHAKLPSKLTIPANATTATFTITTSAVVKSTAILITVSDAASLKSASLTVKP